LGTYRRDRHGPQLQAIAGPAVFATVTAPDGYESFVCVCHGERIVVELLDNHRWRTVRVDGSECGS
jgi:hypothetical protein